MIGDVGQDAYEEIDVGLAANYGWPCKEGLHDHGSDPGCDGVATAAPVLEQPHSAGFCSITGGYVVRDPGLPTLLGRYLYGDYCNAPLRSVDLANPSSDAAVGVSVSGLSSFGQDACGRLLAVSLNGPVYRIVDGQPSACAGSTAPPIPKDTRACRVSVRTSGLGSVRRLHRVTLLLRADEAGTVAAGARLRGVASFRRVSVALAASRRTIVRLRLGASGQRAVRRALRRHRTPRLSLRLGTRDAPGNRATVTRAAGVRG